jgi:hypothetical protein
MAVETEARKDVFDKELCHPCGINVLLQGERITPFVSPWSTMTMTESKPEEGGRSMIWSIETYWKGHMATEARGVRGVRRGEYSPCVPGRRYIL